MIVLGIDPGLSGAVAALDTLLPSAVSVWDMPHADGEVAGGALAGIIRGALVGRTDAVAVVERVHSMPGQGVSTTFKFGDAYGVAKGVLGALGIRMILVPPTKWKKFFCLPGGADGKEAGRSLACRTWPNSPAFSRKKDHGRADAALIAKWALDAKAI